MKKTAFPLFIATILLFSCHKKPIAKTETPPPVAENKKAIVDQGADMNSSGAAYKIDSLSIHNDVLSVFVNYSGGCKEHSFELISNGMYAKSLPPQLSLCLKHTNNDDLCKKLVMQELKFDVSGLQYKGSKTVVLKIGGQSINYVHP